jgi:glycosyltransferase involved in cell wall biosynthesis
MPVLHCSPQNNRSNPIPSDKLKTISIVTPALNNGNYLEETIRSVLGQKGDFFIDYIVMDGGSTDNTVDVLKKYDGFLRTGEFKPRCFGVELRWASEKDRGQTHAINKGFQMAHGEIVSWINSDDLYCDDAFLTVAEHFRADPESDFLFGDGDVIDEVGRLQWEWLSRPYDLRLLKSYHFLWNDFTNYIMQQATFWRKDVLDRIGMLDESLHYAMDIEYWIRAGEHGLKLKHLPVKLGKFRMIRGTKSLSSKTVFWPESLEIFRRYNGAKSMKPFFTYYLFNEAMSNDYDYTLAWNRTSVLLKEWSRLPPTEQTILQQKALQASFISRLKLANKAFNDADPHQAHSLFKTLIREHPVFLLHPLSLIYLLKRIFGQRTTRFLCNLKMKLITEYRMRRYLYRYRHRDTSTKESQDVRTHDETNNGT